MAKSDEQKDETPYTPVPGSALHEMKRIEDMERAEEAAGVYDEEDRRRKMDRQEEEWLVEHEYDYIDEEERRAKALTYRLEHGQVADDYKWMFEHPGQTAYEFDRHFDEMVFQAMQGETWTDYDGYLRWAEHRHQARVALMKEIFPGFSGYLEEKLSKVREAPVDETNVVLRKGLLEARIHNATNDAMEKYMDGQDLKFNK